MSTVVVTCPQCDYDGQQSETRGNSVIVPKEYANGFYDDLGGWHLHNTNNAQVTLECSRGHRFVNVVVNRCWCGWQNLKAQV